MLSFFLITNKKNNKFISGSISYYHLSYPEHQQEHAAWTVDLNATHRRRPPTIWRTSVTVNDVVWYRMMLASWIQANTRVVEMPWRSIWCWTMFVVHLNPAKKKLVSLDPSKHTALFWRPPNRLWRSKNVDRCSKNVLCQQRCHYTLQLADTIGGWGQCPLIRIFHLFRDFF